MMLRVLLCVLCVLCARMEAVETASALVAEGDAAVEAVHYKEALSAYNKALGRASKGRRSEIMRKMAVVHYHDQDRDQAFRSFLEALELAEPWAVAKVSAEERSLYEEAVKIYLEGEAKNPLEMSKQIREAYMPVLEQHPEYLLLNFVVATVSGNVGDVDRFFEGVYKSSRAYPEHFLSYKVRGILHIKLLESSRTTLERELHRHAAVEHFEKAIKANTEDPTVYRLLMSLAKGEYNQGAVLRYLKAMLASDIVIPRLDIMAYVMEAVAGGDRVLAQAILDKAKEHYNYSRAVVAAQTYLEEQTYN